MSQIQQVKELSDILEVIGSRIELKRAGVHLKGLCPFHGEKTPSFFVNESFQRYKCYGCGESGDVFEFLEKYEGMSFYEALKYLAEAAGITLEHTRPDPQEKHREAVLSVLQLSSEYYQYILTQHRAGSQARDYLKQRGISSESLKLFGIGAAPDGWEHLHRYLTKKKKIDPEVMAAAGLSSTGKHGRSYDRFRNRLMFPLKDHRGRIVGFSGRTLDPDAKEAKYINSPETVVYHKSKLLYGYAELRQSIRTAGEVVVVEGELDVISSVQAHVSNVVAIKGSALTADQAKLLRRVVGRVILALDIDAAGLEATKKAIPILNEAGLDLRVAQLAGGKDPDELARHDPKQWREMVKKTQTVYDFFIDTALQKHDQSTPAGKRAIMRELAPILAEVPHAVEREHYIKRLAQALAVKERSVEADIKAVRQPLKTHTKRTSDITPATPPSDLAPLERHIAVLVMHAPLSIARSWSAGVQASDFTHPAVRQFVSELQQFQPRSSQKADTGAVVVRSLAADFQEVLFQLYTSAPALESSDTVVEELDQAYRRLLRESQTAAVRSMSQELAALEAQEELSEAEEARITELMAAIVAVQKKS